MRARSGFSLIELLIALGMLIIVLTLTGLYFAQQSKLSRRTQAHSEVQDRVRLAMQLVTQDLQLAGANRYVTTAGGVLASPHISPCPDDPDDATIQTCFKATDNAGGAAYRDALVTVYVNSLRTSSEACRKVAYRFKTGTTTLQRADAACDSPLTLLPDPDADYVDLADNILALDVLYRCSITGTNLDSYPDGSCTAPSGYLRSAVVTIIGVSQAETPGVAAETFVTASGENVTCPADHTCVAQTQEALLPNLKDSGI